MRLDHFEEDSWRVRNNLAGAYDGYEPPGADTERLFLVSSSALVQHV